VDGRQVADVGELQRLMVGERIGAEVALDVIREGRTIALRLVPAELVL
jgi:S1-C subfamily serine protease